MPQNSIVREVVVDVASMTLYSSQQIDSMTLDFANDDDDDDDDNGVPNRPGVCMSQSQDEAEHREDVADEEDDSGDEDNDKEKSFASHNR